METVKISEIKKKIIWVTECPNCGYETHIDDDPYKHDCFTCVMCTEDIHIDCEE